MTAAPEYADSYYAATAIGACEYPALAGDSVADVCVIGGGFTGLSAALNLAEQGFDVILLEAERVGYGASGRCGGLVGSGQRKDVLETEEMFGLERSRDLWNLAQLATEEIRERVEKHGIACDLQQGQFVGIHKKRFVGSSQALADALTERYAYPHCYAVNAEQTRKYVDTDDFVEGLYDSRALNLHPLNYVIGLARAATEAGVRIYEKSRVVTYSRNDPTLV